MVHAITKSCGAKTVIDVGSGQGYLAQALSFEYELPVVAIDASSHHASVTNTRAERIKKHYAAKCAGKQRLRAPRTVTCGIELTAVGSGRPDRVERRGSPPPSSPSPESCLKRKIANLLAAAMIVITFGQVGGSRPGMPSFFTQSKGTELNSDVDDKRAKLLLDQEALKDGKSNNFDIGTIEFNVLGMIFLLVYR
ncbi:hypothetical protein E2562_013378 [Oryza meyeriana var. granulata]|nr:hypothetical protein E2562_013378 [Oryza meyeriana var. granulata]KAF0899159.1 hypothetical protein E2562_013378 [Oryza meyeriana var. granulata]